MVCKLALVLLIPFSTFLSAEIVKINMKVGSVKAIPCESCTTVQMSRKGYIQVVNNDKELSLIGLRAGVVYLSLPEKSIHYLVTVDKPEEVRIPSTDLDSHKPQKNVVKYWLKVYALAIEQSQSKIDDKLDQFYKLKKSFPELLQVSNEFGLTTRAIAQPRLLVIAGENYLLKSGGEIGVNIDSAEFGGTWKSYGFSLDVFTTLMNGCALGIKYKVGLSRPTKDKGIRKLSSNFSEGYVDLKCEEEELVSVLQFDSTQDSHSQNMFISTLPIIGPIFKKKSAEEGQIQLAIYMKIEKQS